MKVVGVDPSLASTGVAVLEDGALSTAVIRVQGQLPEGLPRLRWIVDRVLDEARGADLVAIEGPSYGSPSESQTGHHERAGLWWRTVDVLDLFALPVAVVSPASLKLYATGKGNARKAEVVGAFQAEFPAVRLPPATRGRADAVDAAWLALMAAHHLGRAHLVITPDHARAVAGVRWPATGYSSASPTPEGAS